MRQEFFIKLRKNELIDDTFNFFNPFFNHFSHEKYYQGRKMDYFGYLAHKMTGRLGLIRLEKKKCVHSQSILKSHSSCFDYLGHHER